jgi:hypothetical protein
MRFRLFSRKSQPETTFRERIENARRAVRIRRHEETMAQVQAWKNEAAPFLAKIPELIEASSSTYFIMDGLPQSDFIYDNPFQTTTKIKPNTLTSFINASIKLFNMTPIPGQNNGENVLKVYF